METTSYFSELANFLLNGMGTNLFQKSNNMISGIAPVFQIGFGIYILLIAFDYYKRGFDENVVDLGKRMIGWLLIIAFCVQFQSVSETRQYHVDVARKSEWIVGGLQPILQARWIPKATIS